MIAQLASRLAPLLLVATTSACVYDWDLGPPSQEGDDDSGEPLPAGSAVTCPSSTTCSKTCPLGGCKYRCESAAHCEFTCSGGGCEVECASAAACTNSCSGGGCTYRCAFGSNCTNSCSGDGCTNG